LLQLAKIHNDIIDEEFSKHREDLSDENIQDFVRLTQNIIFELTGKKALPEESLISSYTL